ncbi:hypothetical protein GSI_11428 [Ganoderma sinense ZZ0214-1]|uniref:F-box domain-containing protein n=1 Tax=Ganoderma sinense ZZ0214-1 TaxID=1077348 RepID=A0A2G8RWH7_9APHY|nr:hypothetical protein GSI_11428 [Ganoderma sinense ZZ0214-1]
MDNIEDSRLQSRHPSLSTEIEENVIDYVYSVDDITTLLNCALTCRDWLPRSRIHLFSAIRLSTREDMYSFCDFLDTHLEFPMLIRSIIMAPNVFEKKPACLLETFPVQLLSRLPRLRGWALRNDLASDRERNISHHPIILRNLRRSSPVVDLDLESLKFASLTVFLRFITSFVQLRHLRCNAIRFDQKGGLKPYGIGGLNLTTLQVGGIPGGALCTLLDRTACTLESLGIASQQDVDGVSAMLSRMSNLRSLTWDIQHEMDWDRITEALSGTPTVPTFMSFRANIFNLDDLWCLKYYGGKELVFTFLEMKLQSFTINVCAKKVHPLSTTIRSMTMFAKFSDEGLYPQLIFTGATFLDELYRPKRIAISPNLQRVAATAQGLDGGILLWNISDGISVRSWHIVCPMVVDPAVVSPQVVFSPENERVLIVGVQGYAYVQDLKWQCRMASIRCAYSLFAAWSPHCIVFLTRTGTICTWDPATYRPIQDYDVFEPLGGVTAEQCRGALLFSPDNHWLAAHFNAQNGLATWILFRVVPDCGGGAKLINPHSLKELSSLAGSAKESPDFRFGEVAFDLESTRMAVLDRLVKVHIWDIAQATPIHALIVDMSTTLAGSQFNNQSLKWPVLPTKLAFSGDGRNLLFLHLKGDDSQKKVQLEVCCAKTGHLRNPLGMQGILGSGPPVRISCDSDAYQFSSCGRYLVASPETGGIIVWRTSDGSLVRRVA